QSKRCVRAERRGRRKVSERPSADVGRSLNNLFSVGCAFFVNGLILTRPMLLMNRYIIANRWWQRLSRRRVLYQLLVLLEQGINSSDELCADTDKYLFSAQDSAVAHATFCFFEMSAEFCPFVRLFTLCEPEHDQEDQFTHNTVSTTR